MLANSSDIPAHVGHLDSDVQLSGTFRYELLDFIAGQLPLWRDRPDRPIATSETILTSQLCGHLNGAARHSEGWDVLQFRVEEADEDNKGRKIDLISAACGHCLWIEGRRHTEFDTLLPIECKRLPTPTGPNRDEREYVISQHATVGGIQRFKAGLHGANHAIGAMIGYVQDGTVAQWQPRVSGWIAELATAKIRGWTAADQIFNHHDDASRRLTILRSSHSREGQSAIELRHLWIGMN